MESSNFYTPHRFETNDMTERDVRRVIEGNSAVLLHSSMKCNCYLRNVQGLLTDRKTACERQFGQPFGAMVKYHPISTRDQSRLHHFGKNLERKYSDCGYRGIGKDGRIRNLSLENQCERSIDITQGRRIHIPSDRWYSKIVRKRLRIPRTHSKTTTNRKE